MSKITSKKTDEIKSVILTKPRFADFNSEVAELEIKIGDSEPKYIKSIRPYLLPSEVVPFTNKTSKGSRGKGKEKETGKVYTPSNPPPNLMNRVPSNVPYKFTQQIPEASLLVTSTTLQTFASKYFTIADLDQYTSLSAVFDQYIIMEVEVWIEPQLTGGAFAVNAGNLYSVIDYDDANNLTSTASACDYTNVISSNGQDSHYRRFSPHIAVGAYSGTFTSFKNERAGWIDFASTGVQHYGLKVACTPTTASFTYQIRSRYHIMCRNVR